MRLLNLLFLVPTLGFGQITFVRHGETLANKTGKYSTATLNTLSELGNTQASALIGKLPPKFDAIYVSPAGRCLRTIAPYLKATGQKAVIWPELLECCHQRGAARNIPVGSLTYGAKIVIPNDLKAYFTIETGHEREIGAATYKAGLRQIGMAADRIKGLPRNQKVLLVSHSLAGARLFEALTGKPNSIKIDNARPIAITRTGSSFSVKKP